MKLVKTIAVLFSIACLVTAGVIIYQKQLNLHGGDGDSDQPDINQLRAELKDDQANLLGINQAIEALEKKRDKNARRVELLDRITVADITGRREDNVQKEDVWKKVTGWITLRNETKFDIKRIEYRIVITNPTGETGSPVTISGERTCDLAAGGVDRIPSSVLAHPIRLTHEEYEPTIDFEPIQFIGELTVFNCYSNPDRDHPDLVIGVGLSRSELHELEDLIVRRGSVEQRIEALKRDIDQYD